MTEQAAQALRERLERVWLFGNHSVEFENEGVFSFSSSFYEPEGKQQISIYITDIDGKMFYRLSRYGASLFYEDGGEISNGTVANEKFQSSFSSQWMPYFRRNCWLSGADIEASAHEKAEWMRGFTKEEVEAWSLKV